MLNSQWSNFSYFFSATNTQAYLQKKYRELHIDHAEQLAYENCYPFMYYLEHGKEYYLQAIKSPLIIQPILLFYGFVHLLKALILTVNPYYPETTSVLAHGVSTRKRKRQDFLFWQDEVKVQKNGLFPFLTKQVFHMEHLEGEKFIMNDLFCQVPELSRLIHQLDGKITFLKVKKVKNAYYVPKLVLDFYHMTENRFTDFLHEKSNQTLIFKNSLKQSLIFEKSNSNNHYSSMLFRYHLFNEEFVLPTNSSYLLLNEILTHYLLLYNLSMIARYETEWWSELVKTMPNKDFPLIETFLTITKEKGPYLIYEKLIEK